MKNMILHIAITTLLASMSACSDEMEPVLTQRDWDGTATYFQSADEHGFSMYYKPVSYTHLTLPTNREV